MNDRLLRPALYYPYIHIRSEHWLKATLLCVPTVKRIVPETYSPEDSPTVAAFSRVVGIAGPLLQTVPAHSSAAHRAQDVLLKHLRGNIKTIRAKYGRAQAPADDDYWMHDAKFSWDLLDFLKANGLAWQSPDPHGYGSRTWYALHPRLGSAVMTAIGLSIAKEEHYDIVTPSSAFHETLLTTDEAAIFDALLRDDAPAPVPTAADARQALSQLVILLSGINLQALPVESIPELQSSARFRTFQELIRRHAQTVDRHDPPEVFAENLKTEAQDIVDAWHQTRRDLSSDVRDALFEQGLVMTSEALRLALGAAGGAELAIAGGVAVSLLVRRGMQWRHRAKAPEPHHYLTEIAGAQSEALRLTFPLGLVR